MDGYAVVNLVDNLNKKKIKQNLQSKCENPIFPPSSKRKEKFKQKKTTRIRSDICCVC